MEIPGEVARFASLAELVRWGLAQRPALLITDVVVQDEFHHDVVVATPDGAWWVFETS